MSYRIHLNINKEDVFEIRSITPLDHLEKVSGTEDDEYPEYVVHKKDLLKIIEFYAKKLAEICEDKMKEGRFSMMHRYLLHSYFSKFDSNNLIHNSDSFLMQYFYLVEIYKKTDRDNKHLRISHG